MLSVRGDKSAVAFGVSLAGAKGASGVWPAGCRRAWGAEDGGAPWRVCRRRVVQQDPAQRRGASRLSSSGVQRGARRRSPWGAAAGGLPTQTPFSAAASAEPGCPCPHCTLNWSGLFGEDQRQLVGDDEGTCAARWGRQQERNFGYIREG